MKRALSFIALGALVAAGASCLLGYDGTQPRDCETSQCGCYDDKDMTFSGYVMDGTTHECVGGKIVVLRNTDGTRVAEDTSKSFGGYLVKGVVKRSPNCGGGEAVIRDFPPDGGDFPEFVWLPVSTPVSDVEIKSNLLRFPFGTTDAGAGHPEVCLPPRRDAGMGDAG